MHRTQAKNSGLNNGSGLVASHVLVGRDRWRELHVDPPKFLAGVPNPFVMTPSQIVTALAAPRRIEVKASLSDLRWLFLGSTNAVYR